MSHPPAIEHSSKSNTSMRGVLTCVGIVVFGLLVFVGLRQAPRPQNSATPSYVLPEVPDHRLRFVWVDARRARLESGPFTRRVAALHPDYLMFSELESEDLMPIVEACGMQRYFVPQAFVAESDGGKPASWGNCILSRYPLYELEPIRGPAGAFAVAGIGVVDGRKFMVASIHMHSGGTASDETQVLVKSWNNQRDGSGRPPPIVAAGALASTLASGDLVQGETGWFDGLTAFVQLNFGAHQLTGDLRPRVLFSLGWACVAGHLQDPASSAAPVLAWVDAASAKTASTTSGTSLTSDMHEP